MLQKLISKIDNKNIKICIVGLGYVGLPLAIEFAKNGLEVIGYDISEDNVNNVNKQKSYLSTVSDDSLKDVSHHFKATTSTKTAFENTDFLIICVPTPLTKSNEPDLKYVTSSLNDILPHLKNDMFVVLESTTYPGTTEEIVVPILEQSGMTAGLDFGIAYSPERVDPGNKKFNLSNTPKIVGGLTEECTDIAALLYGQITEVIKVSSPRTAEATKIIENVFRAVNIALVNELAVLAERLGLDIWEVIDAASTKPYGFMAHYPGPGVGGHCIPVDPFYLSWKAKEVGLTTKFIELAGEINQNMPKHVVNMVTDGLNEVKKSVNGSKIFILGLAYKKDVNDMRNSPMLDVVKLLHGLGAFVSFNDEYIDFITIDGYDLKSNPLEKMVDYDCVIMGTSHSYYDKSYLLNLIVDEIVVIDCINFFKNTDMKYYKKIGIDNNNFNHQ